MKPEPLKNKKILNLSYINVNFNTNRFYKDKDIKSAVEWLKDRLNEKRFCCEACRFSAIEEIDEAFEDVTKTKRR